jgi:hypothetical protein
MRGGKWRQLGVTSSIGFCCKEGQRNEVVSGKGSEVKREYL